MAEESRSVPETVDDITELFERHDAAEMRLAKALVAEPLVWALVMAALCWDQVDRRGWRTPVALGAQARRLVAAWRIPVESGDDAERVGAALEWATQDPALLECDGQGRYRPVTGAVFPVGSRHWRERHRAAAASGALTPLELVVQGDAERGMPDLDAAEVSYRLAVDGDDPDAAAMAALRLAELAEEREQPEQAARRYTEVATLQHPVASPPALLWLARRAAQGEDRPAARALAQEVLDCGDGSLRAEAWGIVGSLAWFDEDRDAAVAAMRRAVEEAGQWHWSYSRRLGEMLAARGDLMGAAEVYRGLLEQPLLHGPDAGRYVQLMAQAGRLDHAVVVLEHYAAQAGPFSGELLLALVSAHAARDDLEAYRQALARVRAHWSATLPHVAVRADVMEASLAAADGDDDTAARLFRSLTDTDDTERRDLARPLLIAAGQHFATDGKLCLIPGARPLLEYLCEVAPAETALWAATSLAHLAAEEDRPADADAALALAARHLPPEQVSVLRAQVLHRAGRGRDALAYLIDAAETASPPALTALLLAITAFGMCSLWPDHQQRCRLRAAVDHALFPDHADDGEGESEGEGGDVRDRVAMAMAQLELYSCFDRDRALLLYQFVTGSDAPTVAASAWLNLGLMRQLWTPIAAAHAFEQAMALGDAPIAAHAATALARLAERLGDNTVLAQACTRVLELTTGEDWARAALRLGRVHHDEHPDDAEAAYHAAITEPDAHPATIGAALARLGALYAYHGNRRLAQRIWRRGQRHRDPHIAEAFAAERARIGRVTGKRR